MVERFLKIEHERSWISFFFSCFFFLPFFWFLSLNLHILLRMLRRLIQVGGWGVEMFIMNVSNLLVDVFLFLFCRSVLRVWKDLELVDFEFILCDFTLLLFASSTSFCCSCASAPCWLVCLSLSFFHFWNLFHWQSGDKATGVSPVMYRQFIQTLWK